MLFYSYAELVVGLIAVFYFTSKVFSIIKYKMYFALSLIFIILTASVACFLKDEQQYVILPVLHFIALTFLPLSLGHDRKIMLIFSSLFFSGFFIFSPLRRISLAEQAKRSILLELHRMTPLSLSL